MSARPARGMAAGQLALELPLELPAIALAPEWKDQERLWGHPFHPMCSYLASFPAALTHAFIARYSRPGDVVLDPVLRARHHGPPGLCRGPDRRRQRPEPVRAPPDRGQGRARHPGPGGHPAGAASPGLERQSAGWLALGGARRSPTRRRRSARVPAAGSAAGPDDGRRTGPGRGRARVPPADARPAAVRPHLAPARRRDRPVPGRGASPGSSTARARATCPS